MSWRKMIPAEHQSRSERSGGAMDHWPQRVADAQRDALAETRRVLGEVQAERARQWMRWGWSNDDPDVDLVGHEHDDGHLEGDWTRFIMRYLGRAEQAIEDNDPVAWRGHLLSVAALAVAAVESHDRRLSKRTKAARFCSTQMREDDDG